MDNQDKPPQKYTPTGVKHICLSFESESHYTACVQDLRQYRAWLRQWFAQHPELFPRDFAAGFHFHAQSRQKKPGLCLRRIKLKASGQVFTLRPSFLPPYLCTTFVTTAQAFRFEIERRYRSSNHLIKPEGRGQAISSHVSGVQTIPLNK